MANKKLLSNTDDSGSNQTSAGESTSEQRSESYGRSDVEQWLRALFQNPARPKAREALREQGDARHKELVDKWSAEIWEESTFMWEHTKHRTHFYDSKVDRARIYQQFADRAREQAIFLPEDTLYTLFADHAEAVARWLREADNTEDVDREIAVTGAGIDALQIEQYRPGGLSGVAHDLQQCLHATDPVIIRRAEQSYADAMSWVENAVWSDPQLALRFTNARAEVLSSNAARAMLYETFALTAREWAILEPQDSRYAELATLFEQRAIKFRNDASVSDSKKRLRTSSVEQPGKTYSIKELWRVAIEYQQDLTLKAFEARGKERGKSKQAYYGFSFEKIGRGKYTHATFERLRKVIDEKLEKNKGFRRV